MAERLGDIGVAAAQRKMRVRQLWHWIYVRGAKNFDEMTSISTELRAQLNAHFTVARPEVASAQISSNGTRTRMLHLAPPRSNAQVPTIHSGHSPSPATR